MYQKVRELCEKRGISVRSLEKELGFSNGSVSKWETSVPGFDKAVKVANYFNVPVSELMEEKKGA